MTPFLNWLLTASFLLVFFNGTGSVPVELDSVTTNPRPNCEWRKNLTKDQEFITFEQATAEEDCLYYYLFDADFEKTGDIRSFHDQPPPDRDINITIEDVIIQYVELAAGSSYQFNLHGHIYLSWSDSRLTWSEQEWAFSTLYLKEQHKIWTPNLIDHSICTDNTLCELEYLNIQIINGIVYATAQFRYAAYCGIDYTSYPEEENTCCIFFTAFESFKRVAFHKLDYASMSKKRLPVVMQENIDEDKEVSRLTQDHTAWVVTKQTVDITHLGGIESLQVLKVCTHAEKRMGTLRMALRLPVTIATLLMLVSPLFGDLRTQSYVKLVTLCLQTVCFLFLCSIAPENGFAGTKPKIYRFYESVFALTTFSMFLTVGCMALSRAKRTVPPSHRVYLAAKLVNRSICCIEPEQSTHYQRYLDDQENQRANSETDFTQDWRHIYMAVNNLFSGLFFTTFIFFTILDVI